MNVYMYIMLIVSVFVTALISMLTAIDAFRNRIILATLFWITLAFGFTAIGIGLCIGAIS